MNRDPAFWRHKSLAQMTRAEWESLCDGCGKCCVNKLEDEETGEIFQTNVACNLLDTQSCRCTNYKNRRRYVPECIQLTPKTIHALSWMPSTCAYRLLSEGQPLPDWHPLITGDPESVHRAGQSARGRTLPESIAGPLEDHVLDEAW